MVNVFKKEKFLPNTILSVLQVLSYLIFQKKKRNLWDTYYNFSHFTEVIITGGAGIRISLISDFHAA